MEPWLAEIVKSDKHPVYPRELFASDAAYELTKEIVGRQFSGGDVVVAAHLNDVKTVCHSLLMNARVTITVVAGAEGTQRVVKLVPHGKDATEAMRKANIFRRELCMHLRASSTGHPNIAHITPTRYVFDAYQGIELELFPLGDFSKLSPDLPDIKRLSLLRDVAAGLAHMHSIGLVHVDIKLQNFCMCTKPVGSGFELSAKVIDFGATRASGFQAKQNAKYGDTPQYRAPEGWSGPGQEPAKVVLDWRTDVWSFGIICLAVMTRNRQPPWSRAKEEDGDFAAFRSAHPGPGDNPDPPMMAFTNAQYRTVQLPKFVNFICYNQLVCNPDQRFTMAMVRDRLGVEVASHTDDLPSAASGFSA